MSLPMHTCGGEIDCSYCLAMNGGNPHSTRLIETSDSFTYGHDYMPVPYESTEANFQNQATLKYIPRSNAKSQSNPHPLSHRFPSYQQTDLFTADVFGNQNRGLSLNPCITGAGGGNTNRGGFLSPFSFIEGRGSPSLQDLALAQWNSIDYVSPDIKLRCQDYAQNEFSHPTLGGMADLKEPPAIIPKSLTEAGLGTCFRQRKEVLQGSFDCNVGYQLISDIPYFGEGLWDDQPLQLHDIPQTDELPDPERVNAPTVPVGLGKPVSVPRSYTANPIKSSRTESSLSFRTETKKIYVCTFHNCGTEFNRFYDLRRHHLDLHDKEFKFPCRYRGCPRAVRGFGRKDKRDTHERKIHKAGSTGLADMSVSGMML